MANPQLTNARALAFNAGLRVEQGAWAEEILRPATKHFSPSEAALAWELTLGPLRVRNQLDFLIAHFSGKTGKLDPEVRIALRMGIYQLRYLDRIPPHAAVKTSVDLVIAARKRSATGFVNAVLRKVHRDEVEWPNAAVANALPEWLWAKWVKQFGETQAVALAAAARRKPASSGPSPDDERQQDPHARQIVPMLQVEPGMRVLDLCSAPGNKSLQLAEAGGNVVACDLHFHRIRQVSLPARVQLDATQPLPFGRQFDRILVDAPCSGTGTLSRNPEIKWRLQPEQIAGLQSLQRQILANALPLLLPGGKLLYATCSLEEDENEAVVGAVAPERIQSQGYLLPGAEAGDGFFHALLS